MGRVMAPGASMQHIVMPYVNCAVVEVKNTQYISYALQSIHMYGNIVQY